MTVVIIESGAIEGISTGNGVVEYRGVPYGKAPTGDLRFRAPQPVTPWQGTRVMDKYGVPAWQEVNPLLGINAVGEDCLHVNLWVPEGQGPFPVMVWLHGGGFANGSASQRLYHGAELARAAQAIVVNVNYRLGAWGFGHFQHQAPHVPQESNLALRDILAALRWVQRNIEAFKGDANCVTLFGESAGGFAVATLMAVPQAQGLFHRAIVQSGAADMVLSPEAAVEVGSLVYSALQEQLGDHKDILLNTGAKEMVRAQRAALKVPVPRGLRNTTPQYGMPFLPVVDGDLLPMSPVQALKEGKAHSVPLLAGTCQEEWNLFQYVPAFNGGVEMAALRELDRDAIQRRFVRVLPEHGEAALNLYEDLVTPHPQRAITDYFTAMESDRLFRIPTHRLLTAHAQAGGDAWGFEFTWDENGMGLPLGAFHVMDVPLVFATTHTPMGKMFTSGSQAAKLLSEQVVAIWGEFVRTGTAHWTPWPSGKVLQLGHTLEESTYIDQQRLALWETIIS